MSKKKVVGYCKVKNQDREEIDYAIQIQSTFIKDYVLKHPDWELTKVYVDVTNTTSPSERKEFQQMIKDCQDGNVDIIITKSVSRFSRDIYEASRYIKELYDKGIEFYFDNFILDHVGNGKMFIEIITQLDKD